MTTPLRSDPALVVLHTLRCAGASSAERVAAIVAHLVDDDAETCLLELAGRGLVTHDGGTFGGWRVTDAGRAADTEQIAQELKQVGAADEVQAAYEEFLPLNTRTLDLCGQWQVRAFGPPMVLNDHSDRVYDARVLAQLVAVNVDAQRICAQMSQHLHRFSHYGPRLASALERARDGELALVTDSLDSYHSVWFQLHEDLLVTLGISREGA